MIGARKATWHEVGVDHLAASTARGGFHAMGNRLARLIEHAASLLPTVLPAALAYLIVLQIA
jgi:hypothetical protein